MFKEGKPVISILMATYNGAMFIENQILSLLQQTFKEWVLLVHDDGSDDTTIEIIKKFSVIDDRIKLIDNEVVQLGVGRNFLSIVDYVDTDYAIFCDQDDIWLERKLEDMLIFAKKHCLAQKNEPSIIYADGFSFESDSGVIDFSGISHNHAKRLNDFLFFNGGYQGCSIMFNRAMVNFIRQYHGPVHHHDDLVSLVAHSFGSVNFLNKKLMLYRQHSGAVTGVKSFSNTPIFKFNNIDYIISKKHHDMKVYLFNEYGDLLSQSNRKAFQLYLEYSVSRFLKRVFMSLFCDMTIGGSKIKLFVKTIIRQKVISL